MICTDYDGPVCRDCVSKISNCKIFERPIFQGRIKYIVHRG